MTADATPPPPDDLDLHRLAKVLTDYRRGDFSVRMPADRTGLAGKICDALNDAIERNDRLCSELRRLSNVVGKEGNIRQRAALLHAQGGWEQSIDAVNALVTDLVQPTTEVTRVIGAVAKGDLSSACCSRKPAPVCRSQRRRKRHSTSWMALARVCRGGRANARPPAAARSAAHL